MSKHGHKTKTKGQAGKHNRRVRPLMRGNTVKISAARPYKRPQNRLIPYVIHGDYNG